MKNHLEMHLTSISEVKASPHSVRNHNGGKIRKLVKHIEKYGQISPIIIERRGLCR